MTCQLYRHFDADGRLLYVGISLSAVARLSQHANGSHWSKAITRVEVETHPSRDAALAAERAAILAEKPLHNVVHNRAPRLAPPDFPPEMPGSFWGEDGEPNLIGRFEDAEGDHFTVEFTWVDGAPDTIKMGDFLELSIDDESLAWLTDMRAVAQEWAEEWRATRHYADYIRRTA